MATRRDSQRSAVYAWEKALPEWPGEDLTLAGCQELVRRVWGDHLHTDAPLVTDGRGRRRACYAPRNHQIRLPRWSRTSLVVLHEAAHAILYATESPESRAHHGPEFARLYLSFLHRYGNVDLSRARARAVHQRPRRVHFARLAEVLALLPEDERHTAEVADSEQGRLLF